MKFHLGTSTLDRLVKTDQLGSVLRCTLTWRSTRRLGWSLTRGWGLNGSRRILRSLWRLHVSSRLWWSLLSILPIGWQSVIYGRHVVSSLGFRARSRSHARWRGAILRLNTCQNICYKLYASDNENEPRTPSRVTFHSRSYTSH